MAERESVRRWKKENTRNLTVTINRNTDKDLFEYLEGKTIGETVKKALRLLMENENKQED